MSGSSVIMIFDLCILFTDILLLHSNVSVSLLAGIPVFSLIYWLNYVFILNQFLLFFFSYEMKLSKANQERKELAGHHSILGKNVFSKVCCVYLLLCVISLFNY